MPKHALTTMKGAVFPGYFASSECQICFPSFPNSSSAFGALSGRFSRKNARSRSMCSRSSLVYALPSDGAGNADDEVDDNIDDDVGAAGDEGVAATEGALLGADAASGASGTSKP